MRLHINKGQLLLVFLTAGFLIGIIYENLVSEGSVVLSQLFLRSSLEQYLHTDVISEKYLWYVAKARVLFLAIVCGMGVFKWKKVFVGLCLMICGFFAGVVTVAAVMQLGMKGILLCMAGILPQGFFYVMAYCMVFAYWFRYPTSRWNRAKTAFVILMFLVGMILETYVNPLFVKMIIKIL